MAPSAAACRNEARSQCERRSASARLQSFAFESSRAPGKSRRHAPDRPQEPRPCRSRPRRARRRTVRCRLTMLRAVLAFCFLACANALVVPARAGAITMASPSAARSSSFRRIAEARTALDEEHPEAELRLRQLRPGVPGAGQEARSTACRSTCANGNINRAYLAAERKENEMAKKNNRKTLTARRKQMESKGTFLLDSYIEKKIGNVGRRARRTTSRASNCAGPADFQTIASSTAALSDAILHMGVAHAGGPPRRAPVSRRSGRGRGASCPTARGCRPGAAACRSPRSGSTRDGSGGRRRSRAPRAPPPSRPSAELCLCSQRWHRFERCATQRIHECGRTSYSRRDLRAAAAPNCAGSDGAASPRGGALADLRRLPVLGARLRKVRLAERAPASSRSKVCAPHVLHWHRLQRKPACAARRRGDGVRASAA